MAERAVIAQGNDRRLPASPIGSPEQLDEHHFGAAGFESGDNVRDPARCRFWHARSLVSYLSGHLIQQQGYVVILEERILGLRAMTTRLRAIPGMVRLLEFVRRYYKNHSEPVLVKDFDGSIRLEVRLDEHMG